MKPAYLFAASALLAAMPAAAQNVPEDAAGEAVEPAALPDAARAMIDAALATGDRAKVRAVVDAARAAFPANRGEIDEVWSAFDAEQRQIAARKAEADELALREAGLFDNWSGKGQAGGFYSSGNTEEVGATAALNLERKGIDWEHRLRLSADYRRANGITTREQYLALYEPRYQINERLFAYGLTQFERDRRQGFSARYSVSGGLGYRVVDSDDVEFSVKAGPAYRITKYTDGTSNSRLAGLFGADFDWQISDTLKLTQDANATAETGGEVLLIVDGSNTSLSAITGLEAGLNDWLTARLSYAVEYDSNPRAGAVATDTLTRFTLIYGF